MPEPIYGEIVNMSDKYTIDYSDRMAACVADLLLGEGSYCLKSADGSEQICPFFMFGNKIEDWWSDEKHPDLDSFITAEGIRIADALDTVLIGDREKFEWGLKCADDKEAFKCEWHDKYRTSFNDIGGRAKAYSEVLRKRDAEHSGIAKGGE